MRTRNKSLERAQTSNSTGKLLLSLCTLITAVDLTLDVATSTNWVHDAMHIFKAGYGKLWKGHKTIGPAWCSGVGHVYSWVHI